jgi:predicted nucleotidyltransferase
MLGEFMGAIHHKGDQYLNFLLNADRESRLLGIKRIVQESTPPSRVRVFVFGSFIRRKSYGDIDILITYEESIDAQKLKMFESSVDHKARKRYGEPHIGVASEREFGALRLKHDNITQVYP